MSEFTFAGISVKRLAAMAGQTPFYAYDRMALTARMAALRESFPVDVHFHYAVKANPMPALVCRMAGLADGFDVASGGELQTVLNAGAAPGKISFAGPGKSDAELLMAIAAKAIINVESRYELERIIALASASLPKPRVALRVNPDFELKSAGMKMGGGSKPFGIDAENIPDLYPLFGDRVCFEGFHIFSGSQNLRADAIIEAQEKSVDLAIRLSKDAPRFVSYLNLGGGFGIPYFPGDVPLDVSVIGNNFRKLMYRVREELPQAQVVIELGRYLVGEAGVYVCSVIDRKVSRGQVYLVTNGGLHHHLAASGNFGQVIRKNYPVVIDTKEQNPAIETVSIVGPLCTPLDILADKIEAPVAAPGDLVIVKQSGAYGLTASPRSFLSQPDAVEMLI